MNTHYVPFFSDEKEEFKFRTFINDTPNRVMSISLMKNDREIGTSHTSLNTCEIVLLTVLGSYQREGYGRKIVKKTEREARNNGCQFLTARPIDTSGEEFWTKVGYGRSWWNPFGQMWKRI